ncbi:MAG: hypothetical protein R3E54_04510 [Halioglobus sp.]
MTITTRHNMSVVHLIVRRHRSRQILENLLADGVPFAMTSNARGTLIRDRWYHNLLPIISPELTQIQLLVPDPAVDSVMERAARHAGLHRSGAGSIHSQPVDDLHVIGDMPLWPLSAAENPAEDASLDLQENLTAIYFISQGERTDAICRAAMRLGSHGPIVQYTEGHGLRDRLGWLRITSKPIKEVVSLLVENVDADQIFEVMAVAGQVEQAARGLIYRMPVSKGFVNIDSVYSETRHAATLPQIIRAIDDLKGNKAWRERDAFTGRTRAGLTGRAERPTNTQAWSLLSVVVNRDMTRQVSLDLLERGIPGASIDFLQLHPASDDLQHRELAHIRCVVETPLAVDLEQGMLEAAHEPMMVYRQVVSRLVTYTAGESPARKRKVYRGVAVNTD